MSQWKPNATVAAIVEKDGKFLMVEERIHGQVSYNQPAGHWEFGETITEALIRETREETGWIVEPTALIGIYSLPAAQSERVYLRFAFLARPIREIENAQLDQEIVAAHWMTREEISACRAQHRSHVVEDCLNDALSGEQFPLSIFRDFPFPSAVKPE